MAKLAKKVKNWKDIDVNNYPKVGLVCLVYGISMGDYGYADDEEVILRCRILQPKTDLNGNIKASVEILESMPRYFTEFIPLKYKTF